jgi:hypothetical protein
MTNFNNFLNIFMYNNQRRAEEQEDISLSPLVRNFYYLLIVAPREKIVFKR